MERIINIFKKKQTKKNQDGSVNRGRGKDKPWLKIKRKGLALRREIKVFRKNRGARTCNKIGQGYSQMQNKGLYDMMEEPGSETTSNTGKLAGLLLCTPWTVLPEEST